MRHIAPKTKGALLPRAECSMSPYIPSARDITDLYPEATWAILCRDTRIMLFQVPIMLCSYSQHQANYAHCFVPIMLSIAHAAPTQLWGDGAFLHDCTAAPIPLVMQSTLPCK